ncbi:hypothetical protein [Sphingomonas sp.]|jgi:hypothetical protein|uniref:hypothetical protein n=1 Tax=Sphingomonas sp. TaxID=28214 RepID=UPI002E3494D4|nr:hypothetical protein [Sphingomonas sp.]HEX4694081.1 hypothetical protein [Sphingomonas sp.]
MPSEVRHYRLFGLTLASAIELPDLREVTESRPDVTITIGEVPMPAQLSEVGLNLVDDAAVLPVVGAGRYRVRGGTSIQIDPEPGAPAANIRLFLLGSAMGALLHQRGMLPLHANAIDVGGRAIAFIGRSGAGKSTLAAAFHDHGCALLSDDICVVTEGPDGGQCAQPGIPRVRLWRDAVERSGRDAAGLDVAYAGVEKYVLQIGETYADTPLPLAAIYVLAEPDEGDAPPEIAPITGAAAIRALAVNTYRGAYVPLVGSPADHFAQCQALVRDVPIFLLRRPWRADRIDETVRLVTAQVARVSEDRHFPK